MFTVKLATGKTFTATAVEEVYGLDSLGLTLRVEATPAANPLAWYLGLLQEEGALDNIQVLLGEKPCLEAAGYSKIHFLSQRLLPTGDKQLSLSLSRPEAAANTGPEGPGGN